MNGTQIPLSDSFFQVGDVFEIPKPGAEGDEPRMQSISFGYEDVEIAELHPNCRCEILPIDAD